MIRRIINVSVFAAILAISANALVQADCGQCGSVACGGNCATGLGCPGGCGPGVGCFSGLFGPGHHASGGPCLTCENIWDDYCAERQRCLPQPKYPFPNGLPNAMGCAPCAPGGVGIYGACGPGCGGLGILGHLFNKHKTVVGCSDGGCADPGCASGGCAAPATAAPAPVYSTPAPTHAAAPMNGTIQSQPYPSSHPVQSSPASSSQISPMDVDVPKPTPQGESLNTPNPVPPKPEITDQTKKTGTFNWLQRALNTN